MKQKRKIDASRGTNTNEIYNGKYDIAKKLYSSEIGESRQIEDNIDFGCIIHPEYVDLLKNWLFRFFIDLSLEEKPKVKETKQKEVFILLIHLKIIMV